MERVLHISSVWKFANLSGLPEHAQAAMREAPDIDADKDRFGIAAVDARDPYRAIIQVYEYLDDARSLTLLQVGEVPATWSEDSYIFAAGSDVGEVYTTENSPIPGRRTDARLTARMIRNTEMLAKNLEAHFDLNSKERIRRALVTAGTVIDTHQDEVRLISLWSSLEVLIGDPPDLNSRISHFLRHLVPLIVVRYHRRMFVVIYEQFMIQYGKSFQQLMKSATRSMDGTLHTKFAQLLLLPEQEKNRELLTALCANNPLLRHRVWRLYKQYSTPKDALATMRGHADRVQWQLNRVYRVRNMLVHSGRAPPVLDTLVQNCVEYLRAAVINIVRVGARSPNPSVLDEVIAEISFDWTILCQALEERKSCNFDKALVQAVFKAL